MKLIVLTLAILVAGAAAAIPAHTRPTPDYSKVQEAEIDLGHGFYALRGVGGTTTVAVGRDGVIVVDSQVAQVSDQLRAKIASLSNKPIKYVVNTHYHADHAGGDAAFRNAGATIMAHENVVTRMLHPVPEATGVSLPPSSPDGIPNASYSGENGVVKIDGVTANLYHVAPAHTDGDTVVIFPEADVISAGAIVTSASFPNFEIAVGGNIDGMIAAADFVIANCNAATKVVPASGPITDKDGVIEYRNMLQTARDRIARDKTAGMTEQQVVDADPLTDLEARWKPKAGSSAHFISIIYETVPYLPKP
jgi:glyoxylase-like metal-dependent hydrolase (beta-lactamase superfamily II)